MNLFDLDIELQYTSNYIVINSYSVIITFAPDAIEPPLVLTEPPSEAEASMLKKTVAGFISSSNESVAQDKIEKAVRKKIEKRFITLVFG